ncbi:MAG: tetratricopeptide repeat protein [Candidatus Thorarchaeota archaeon]
MSKKSPATRYEYYRAAKEHEEHNQFEEALAAYDKAIELSETYAHAWFNKSRLLYRMEKYGECIGCAEKARQLEPIWSDHITRMIEDAKSRM